jgi:hypothetical protein
MKEMHASIVIIMVFILSVLHKNKHLGTEIACAAAKNCQIVFWNTLTTC